MVNASCENKRKGLIFNIQRFSIHDGPGIRTTVFIKGCPLRCLWCSNPESWNPYPEIMASDLRCIKCGRCAQVCPVGAITIDELGRKIDRAKCNLCLRCIEACLTEAIILSGRYVTVEEAVAEVQRDELFYLNSGGGVTVSGGEPLNQWEFVHQLLKECNQRGLHTALDTCGYARWDVFERVLEYTDLVLFDIKHMDPYQHRKGTKKDNRLILDNARRVAAKARIWLRIPLIPGYNDSRENIEKTAGFGREIGAEKVSILPYHELGMSKHERLGRRSPQKHIQPPSDEELKAIEEIFKDAGVKVSIGN